jgi:hypothetical protein
MPRPRPDPIAWHGSSAVTVSKSELAEELGLSAGRISQMIATGLPVLPDGALDLAEAAQWVLRNLRDPKAAPTREAAADALRSALGGADLRRAIRAAAEVVAASTAAVARANGMPEAEAAALADAALARGLPALNMILAHDSATPLPPPPPGCWRRAGGDPEEAPGLLYDVTGDRPRQPIDRCLAGLAL